ncbi:MAG: hypothetical protein K2W82_16205 [Candidatus Obscuribacterales bacterium]|nr:hypothetical protein [Candidatus Obscuribacterales bacterium]
MNGKNLLYCILALVSFVFARFAFGCDFLFSGGASFLSVCLVHFRHFHLGNDATPREKAFSLVIAVLMVVAGIAAMRGALWGWQFVMAAAAALWSVVSVAIVCYVFIPSRN